MNTENFHGCANNLNTKKMNTENFRGCADNGRDFNNEAIYSDNDDYGNYKNNNVFQSHKQGQTGFSKTPALTTLDVVGDPYLHVPQMFTDKKIYNKYSSATPTNPTDNKGDFYNQPQF